jgi:hypothetical protein
MLDDLMMLVLLLAKIFRIIAHSITQSLTQSLSHPLLAYHNPRPLILILIGSLALTSSTGFYLLIVTPPLTHSLTHAHTHTHTSSKVIRPTH